MIEGALFAEASEATREQPRKAEMVSERLNRRSFLSALAGLPLIGKYWKPTAKPPIVSAVSAWQDIAPLLPYTTTTINSGTIFITGTKLYIYTKDGITKV